MGPNAQMPGNGSRAELKKFSTPGAGRNERKTLTPEAVWHPNSPDFSRLALQEPADQQTERDRSDSDREENRWRRLRCCHRSARVAEIERRRAGAQLQEFLIGGKGCRRREDPQFRI